MKNKSNIIQFPKNRIKSRFEDQFDDELDMELEFEAGVAIQEFIDNKDYPGLVRFCKQIAENKPRDLYAQFDLGNAYVLNGEYEKAIEFMVGHHKKHPWNSDYHHVILDSLYALGKTEDDFDWVEKPVILRMSKDVPDTCYEFLKYKRKPRSIMELYVIFIMEGYLLFSEKDLLEALLNDERFEIDNPESEFDAKVSVVRKKKK